MKPEDKPQQEGEATVWVLTHTRLPSTNLRSAWALSPLLPEGQCRRDWGPPVSTKWSEQHFPDRLRDGERKVSVGRERMVEDIPKSTGKLET